jgi:hypothetical protein
MNSKKVFLLAAFLVISICLSFSQHSENDMIGKWKISGSFCTEEDDMPDGSSIKFNDNYTGFFEHNKVQEKDNFTWNVITDTLKLNFDNKKGIHSVLFEKTNFTFRKLDGKIKQLEIRFIHYRQCGYRLEFIE